MDYRWDETAFAACADELDRLVYLAGLIGSDEKLAQAGGGNASIKRRETDFAGREVETLWVKGSGMLLRGIQRRDFTGIRIDDIRRLRDKGPMTDEEMMAFMGACRLDPLAPLPSVETPIHSILPFPCVIHTHDLATQALTDTSKKDAFVREVWGEDVHYIGYVRPGYPLARSILGLGDLKKAKALVLGKHGLVTWGQTLKECYDSLHDLVTRAEKFLVAARGVKNPLARQRHSPGEPVRRSQATREILPVLRGLLSRTRKRILHLDSSEDARQFADSELAKQVHRRGMASPDHILRCGRQPLYVDATLASLPLPEAAALLAQSVETFENDYRLSFGKHGKGTEMLGPGPRVVLLPGLGLVTAARDKKSAEVAAHCYRQVMRVIEAAESIDQFRFLEEASAFEFEYWPMELARLREPEPELSRRVAVVTGGASGMGRSIAERFALEGAHVVLTDLDGEGARQVALEIGGRIGDPSRVIGLRADATDETETAAAFAHAVMTYGGVDILVCNAGIVQPAPVEKFTPETWDRHFDVNVKGYWLATREAVRIMKAQGGGAIVYNASKAAFAPTADNAAYASSKAAVAALARNLALELAPSAIRVNYFNADFIDTPMIRKMAQERAALKGISPDAQLEEYRKRNLLGVGPIPPEAVAEAALFLASERSRFTTGAVLTVDGGLRDAMPR